MTNSKIRKLLAVLTLALACAALPQGVRADEPTEPEPAAEEPQTAEGRVQWRDNVNDSGYAVTYIRGDAARALFKQLPEEGQETVTRPRGGSVYFVRRFPSMACSYSTLFNVDRMYLCAFATDVTGKMIPVAMDPEFGAVASIGVGN